MKRAENASPSLGLALIILMIGVYGTIRGASELSRTEPPSAPNWGNAAEVEMAEATASVYMKAPYRRPVAAANIVVSALLFVSGLFLWTRRPTAKWWVTQAIVANGIWTLVESGTVIAAAVMLSTRFDAIQESITKAGDPSAPPGSSAALFITTVIALGAIRIGIYAFLLSRVRRAEPASA